MCKCKKSKMIDVQVISNGIKLPAYQTQGSAALDLQANIEEPIILCPNRPSVLVPTGLKIYHGDPNVCALIIPRSGMAFKHGLAVGNNVGLIDSDYQGELMVNTFIREGYSDFTLEPGTRFAQLLFLPIVLANLVQVQAFSEQTKRGRSGHGSTGVTVPVPS